MPSPTSFNMNLTDYQKLADELNTMPLPHLSAFLRNLGEAWEEQKRLNLELARRLAACSEVLSKAAERGKVCKCQQ